MSSKRKILFGVYHLLKALRYLDLRNNIFRHANIICFHRVNDYDNSHLSASTRLFEEIIREVSNQYHPVPLQVLIDKLNNNKPIRPKTMAITFDDGYRDNLLYAAPILRKYNVPATFFITSGYIGTNRVFPWDESNKVSHPLMTWDEVRELNKMGFEIGSHTVTDVNLGKVPVDVARQEIFQSKEQIEDEISQQANTFAVPFGRKDCITPESRKMIKEAGFQCCCMLFGGKVTQKSDLFDLPRVALYPTLTEMMMELDNFMVFYDYKMKTNIFRNQYNC